MLDELPLGDNGDLSLAEKIDLVEKQLNIFLTVHDMRGILSLNFRDYLLPGRRWHRAPFCWEGRFEHDSWSANCTRDCMNLPHNRCRCNGSAYWKKCWKHVWELVVPIERNGQTMLILFAGLFRDDKAPAAIKLLPEFHQKFYRQLPFKSQVQEQQLAVSLQFFGQTLLTELEKATQSNDNSAVDTAEIIRRYIAEYAATDITVASLAKHLCLSLSRTSHAVKQYLGKTFGELLREERMSRAKNLLGTHPGIAISELAAAVGYKDPAYFIRCFSKTFGMGPRSYQKNILNK